MFGSLPASGRYADVGMISTLSFFSLAASQITVPTTFSTFALTLRESSLMPTPFFEIRVSLNSVVVSCVSVDMLNLLPQEVPASGATVIS